MARPKRKHLAPAEQHVLEHLHLRLLTAPADLARCDRLLVEHHYLHDATLVGEHLRQVVSYKGRWLALATGCAAALHLKARDGFIGWTPAQCRIRRSLIANNARLLVLPPGLYPNLVSRFMKLMLARLAADWQARWQHPVVLAESFIEPHRHSGTAYKVSGWSHLGHTAGWKRDADDFYVKHDAPKQLWVRELVKQARVQLRAPKLPPAWAGGERNLLPRCTTKAAQILGLMDLHRTAGPEFRRRWKSGGWTAGR